MAAFGKEMGVEIAEYRRKGINVVELDQTSIAFGAQAVTEDRRLSDRAGEQSSRVSARQFSDDGAAGAPQNHTCRAHGRKTRTQTRLPA